MKDSLLFSRDWCDLVFEGRNKEYGAYVLRRNAGRRYRFAACIILGVFFLLSVVAAVTGYFAYKAIQRTMAEVEEVVHLKPLKDPEIRRISVGRRAVANASPNAVSESPEVVDEEVQTAVIGIKGPDDGNFVQESSLVDKDAHHNADQEDLPIEGAALLPVDVIEEMPMFPGGPVALMKYMDETCVYSPMAIRKKLQGDVEVAFIIDEEGNVIEPEILSSSNSSLDNTVLLAVKKMPKWKAGTNRGRPVPVKISIPVHFQLD